VKGAVALASAAALPFDPLKSAQLAGGEKSVHTVEIDKFRFIPENLTVKPFDIIIWINRDFVPHTATADDESWDTGGIEKGGSHKFVIRPGMATRYYCRFHPNMKASFDITPVTE